MPTTQDGGMENDMKKEFTCIVCPNGCTIMAEYDGKPETITTAGALCRRGDAYVRQELTNPCRTISSSVLVTGGESDLVSVRLTSPIPLAKIPEAMEMIRGLRIKAPVAAGDVLLPDLFETGSNVIATRSVKQKVR